MPDILPRLLLDANGLAVILDRLADDLSREFIPGTTTSLVGVLTRGVPLARRLAHLLASRHGLTAEVGTLDITLYRDDLGQRRRWPVVRGSAIPFAIDQRRVILVDDVLFTGRTTYSAMAALFDLGRPAVLRLAVLIDRGHREFPIQPDYAGLVIPTAPGDRVNVRLTETDGVDEVVLA